MVRLRRIPAIRAANVLTLTIAIPYGIVLLVFGLVLGTWWVMATGTGQTSGFIGLTMLSGVFAAWAVATISIWIAIAIGCALYNLIAGRLGGIELEFRTIPPNS